MAKQYNMYNVQLSEFWKQRVGKESMFNAPYLTGADDSEYDVASEAPSRAPSQLSSTSTVTQQKVRARTPSHALALPAGAHRLCRGACPHVPPLTLRPAGRFAQIEELTKKLEEERAKRVEAEKMLASFQDGSKR